MIEIYRDISDNIRHCGNMQFAQMTIWIAISGGGVYLLFGSDLEHASTWVTTLATIAFAFIGIMFLGMNERLCEYWNYYLNRAKTVEKNLLTSQYSHKE